MRIVGDPRRRGEAAIVVRHENREEGLGGGRGGETPQAQLLDEAILERAVGALDPALRLRAVGAETVDVEVAEGAAELRSEEHTSELQSRLHLVCRLLLEKKKYNDNIE